MISAQESARPILPPFRVLAGAAAAANAPLLAWQLIEAHPWAGFSVLAGLLLGLAVYGSLYLFVGRGMDVLMQNVRGQARPATGGATLAFALLLPAKYVVLGGMMWLLWRSGHLSLVWFGAGFLMAQLSVTTMVVTLLARRPR